MKMTAEERRLRHNEYHRKYNNEYNRKYGVFMYPRRTWTVDEDLMVLEHSMTDAELSKLIRRSRDAIGVRRNTLKTMFKAHMV